MLDINNTNKTFLKFITVFNSFWLQGNSWGYIVRVEDPGVKALICDADSSVRKRILFPSF